MKTKILTAAIAVALACGMSDLRAGNPLAQQPRPADIKVAGEKLPALLDLLVLDRDNPRSLGWVAHTVRGRLAKLAGAPAGEATPLADAVPDPKAWTLEALCARDADGRYATLMEVLQRCVDGAYRMSDELTSRYFTHSGDARYSVGA